MSNAVLDGLSRSRSVYSTAYSQALEFKAKFPGIDFTEASGVSQLNNLGNRAANKQRYALYRGWVYAAINAIALEGAGQSPNVGKLTGSSQRNQERSSPGSVKSWDLQNVPKHIGKKAARQELEVLTDHPILHAMERPNSFQHSHEFVYSFFANLNLTGWGYIIGGETDLGLEFFSIPTTWVTPVHKNGKAFSEFIIKDPNSTSQKGVILGREFVSFAYLPHPGDPKLALSPSQAQSAAIKIDDSIQFSQQRFFSNGIFPSMIITIGKNPHPDLPGGGVRPRLNAAQKRQIIGSISKEVRGVTNYGNPAIVDGMIERIDRLSATQVEMGWEKSEKAIRTRILSAFGVHPFILGEEIVGSYAQAYVVRDIFCQRVNVYLNLLSTLMTEFVGGITEGSDKFLIWWDECKAKDPQLELKRWEGARAREDVSQNEFRAFMNLPPDEDRNESLLNRQSLSSVLSIATQVSKGDITADQGTAILVSLGLPTSNSEDIAGEGPEETVEVEEEEVESISNDEDEIPKYIVSMSESHDDEIGEIKRLVDTQIEQQKSQVQDVKLISAQMKVDVLSELNRISQDGNRKDELSELGSTITKSFDAIADSIKTPSVINVEPADVQFSPSIDIAPAEINVTNEIPTSVINVEAPQIKNEIKSPEVHIEVKPADVSMPDIHIAAPNVSVEAPNVNIEAPDINIEAPNVQVTNKVEVEVPQTEVNVTREGAPKRAEIKHPDGRISKIELKE